MKMSSRRHFLRSSAMIGSGLLFSNQLFSAFANTAFGNHSIDASVTNTPSLKGFIVSDAHFGWESDIQPAPEMQKQMIDNIRRRFPDLDVMIDTGDAHHNGTDRDRERGDWSDIIMYEDDPIPFFYVPGNHEICHANDHDVEFRCAVMGSHEARPYYSFDIKGIHFVSVPELLRAVYIPRELLEWLRLDMKLNKGKTTILLSHNSLIGYSKTFEEGYRGVVNTAQIIDLMNAYPNCIAWMYGHNHNYEVVEKLNKLFISNGRIGGFDPSKGKHGLGGIYFEITSDMVDIRCYSAEFDKFVEEIDNSEPYRGKLAISTSFDATVLPAYSAGVGMARNGEKSPLYHHFVTSGKSAELHIAGVGGTIINEDPDFTMFMVRKPAIDRQLMGCSISENKASYEWKDPGILMLPSEKKQIITLPRASHNKYTYYRVAAGHDYKVTLDLQGLNGGGQNIAVRVKLFDRQGEQVMAAPLGRYILTGVRQQIVQPVKFPAGKISKSIYTDENSDNVFNFSVEIEFEDLRNEVMVHRVAIEFANAGEHTARPSVAIGKEKFGTDATLVPGEYRSFTLKPRTGSRSVVTVDVAGNGMATWLYRIKDLQWQVLGAQVEERPSSMLIGPMRNLFSHRKEVAINPYGDFRSRTFVSRLRNVDVAEVFPLEKGNKQIMVKALKTLSGKAEIEVFSPRNDLKISGGKATRNGNKYIIPVVEGATVTIKTY